MGVGENLYFTGSGPQSEIPVVPAYSHVLAFKLKVLDVPVIIVDIVVKIMEVDHIIL